MANIFVSTIEKIGSVINNVPTVFSGGTVKDTQTYATNTAADKKALLAKTSAKMAYEEKKGAVYPTEAEVAAKEAEAEAEKIAATVQGSVMPLPKIFGMPPVPNNPNSSIYNLWRNSAYVISIEPCDPDFSKDANLFTLKSVLGDYLKELREGYKYGYPNQMIQVCAQADSFPSENFSNEYGESMFNKAADILSSGAQDIMQITNSTDILGAATKFGNATKGIGVAGFDVGEKTLAASKATKKWISEHQNTTGAKGFAANIGNAANMLLAGSRLDFPNVWRNSSFTSSYSCTVRLYNPSPGNDKASSYFIWGPLTALLLLALPRKNKNSTKDFFAFNYPYFCRVMSKGLFGIKQGCITGISVNKGVENQIAFNQKLGMVDVKIDFSFLHSHMIASADDSDGVPTLRKYIDNLKETEPVQQMYIKKWTPGPVTTKKDIGDASVLPTLNVGGLLGSEPPFRVPENLATLQKDLTAGSIISNMLPVIPQSIGEGPTILDQLPAPLATAGKYLANQALQKANSLEESLVTKAAGLVSQVSTNATALVEHKGNEIMSKAEYKVTSAIDTAVDKTSAKIFEVESKAVNTVSKPFEKIVNRF